MQIERLNLALRNAIGLNKLDASRMHIVESLSYPKTLTRYNIREGNLLKKYTIGDTFVQIDTLEKNAQGKFIRLKQEII